MWTMAATASKTMLLVLQDWMQYLQGLPADVGAIPLLICATKEDLPGKQRFTYVFLIVHSPSVTLCSNHGLA